MLNLKNSVLILLLFSGATLIPTYDGPEVIIFRNQTKHAHTVSIETTYDKNSKKAPNPSTVEIQMPRGGSYIYTNFNLGLTGLKLKLNGKPMQITYYNPGNKYMWPSDYSDLNNTSVGSVAKIFLMPIGAGDSVNDVNAEFLYPTLGERFKYWFMKKFTWRR